MCYRVREHVDYHNADETPGSGQRRVVYDGIFVDRVCFVSCVSMKNNITQY